MEDYIYYLKEDNYTKHLASSTGALTEMLLGLIGWEPFEQGNYIESDLFYLGENDGLSIENAMKERFRGNWYVCTDLSEQAQERIISGFSLDLELLDVSFEKAVTDIVISLMKESYRNNISDYQRYINEYCEEVKECFGMQKIKAVFRSTKKTKYRLMEENYGLFFFGAVFLEFEGGHVLMLLPSNSE